MEQKDIIKRLSEYIEYDALTKPATFAKGADIDPSGFGKMLKGQQTITVGTLKKIANAYGLSLKWLMDGVGDVHAPSSKVTDFEPNANDETRPRIPMAAAAGVLAGFSDSIKSSDCEQRPIIRAFPPYDCTIIVKGHSMEPKFEGGDEIAIKKVYDTIEWGKTYVLNTRDGAVLKRLYDNGDTFKCVSFNPEYPDFEVNKGDVFGVYKVVGLLRV
jgi:repressor LexA